MLYFPCLTITINLIKYFFIVNTIIMKRIQTHTYWMTFEEYEKWSSERPKYISNMKKRTHIFFIE